MIPTKAYNLLVDLLPMIILFTIVMSMIRIITIIYCKEKIIWHKELKTLIYVIYCFALFTLVTSSDFESYSNNFIPFKEILRYKTTSILFFRNVIGNIILFVPFGYLITDMIRDKAKKCNIFVTMFITLFTSLTIEVIQMFIGRSFDIDDIILNFIGGLIGYLLYFILHKLYKLLPEKFHTDKFKFWAFILLLVIFIVVFYVIYEVF